MAPNENIETQAPVVKKPAKAFTRGGDRGLTEVGVEKDGTPMLRYKDDIECKLWGDIDTLSAYLGMMESRTFRQYQKLLSTIIGWLYNGQIDQDQLKKYIGKMERYCEKHQHALSDQFVLPSGWCHLARAMCRQCERRMVTYARASKHLEGAWMLVRFFNRFSSYLFVYSEAIDDDDV